jgi:hypothetical protein
MRGNKHALVVCAILAIAFCNFAAHAQSPTPSPAPSGIPSVALYGPYPTNYKEIITDWLEFKLVSADTARINWLTEPYAVDLKGPGATRIRGYRVDFSVDAKNLFGTYTGRQKHGAIIRNGDVIQGIGLGY